MSTRTLTIRLAIALLACAPVVASASSSGGMGGGSMGPSSDMPAARSPQQIAVDDYNSGVAHKQRALSYLKDASTATDDKDRQKAQKKAEDQFQAAVKDLKKAISNNKSMYPAMNELGFAYRKLGNYDESLKQYNAALALKPGYPPALEYRAEAYLALAKYEDTKNAYL